MYKRQGQAALAVESIVMAGEIHLNDDLLWRDASLVEPLSRSWNMPRYWRLPQSSVRDGLNTLWIRVTGVAGQTPGLGPVHLGEPEALLRDHEMREWRNRTLFQVNLVISATLGALFFFLWAMQPRLHGPQEEEQRAQRGRDHQVDLEQGAVAPLAHLVVAQQRFGLAQVDRAQAGRLAGHAGDAYPQGVEAVAHRGLGQAPVARHVPAARQRLDQAGVAPQQVVVQMDLAGHDDGLDRQRGLALSLIHISPSPSA